MDGSYHLGLSNNGPKRKIGSIFVAEQHFSPREKGNYTCRMETTLVSFSEESEVTFVCTRTSIKFLKNNDNT